MFNHVRAEMYRLLIYLSLVSILTACSEDDGIVGMRGRIFKLEDPKKHELVLDRFDEEGIEYLVDEGGFAVTLIKDQARVDGIKREIFYGSELRSDVWELAMVMTPEAQVAYEAAFTEAGIEYELKNDDG